MPPRLLGDSATATPIKPNTIAIRAKISPQTAPVVKLKNAAITAMMDGMLKLELCRVVVLMRFVEVKFDIVYRFADSVPSVHELSTARPRASAEGPTYWSPLAG